MSCQKGRANPFKPELERMKVKVARLRRRLACLERCCTNERGPTGDTGPRGATGDTGDSAKTIYEFTAPGPHTLTVPDGAVAFRAFLVGGGGGGGAGYVPGNNTGAGGGGGGYSAEQTYGAVSGMELTISIGEGGTGGFLAENGHTGEMTSLFVSDLLVLSANGGEPGTWSNFTLVSGNGGDGYGGGGSGGCKDLTGTPGIPGNGIIPLFNGTYGAVGTTLTGGDGGNGYAAYGGLGGIGDASSGGGGGGGMSALPYSVGGNGGSLTLTALPGILGGGGGGGTIDGGAQGGSGYGQIEFIFP